MIAWVSLSTKTGAAGGSACSCGIPNRTVLFLVARGFRFLVLDLATAPHPRRRKSGESHFPASHVNGPCEKPQ